MKVCLISGEFRPMQGGVGDFTYEVGQALRDLEATVMVLTSTAAGPPRDEDGLRVEPRLKRWGWGSWGTILRTAEELEADVLNIQYQAAAYGQSLKLPEAANQKRWTTLVVTWPRCCDAMMNHSEVLSWLELC